ncbi:ribosomal protein S3 (mitochondrion) [Saprolegnia parasitica CBS 223.65]|uniref:Ribosomal protein S3 n=1 Tax=Saprolegnia parasitica (strain CBS 223.65) TaxID=695850 RepID=A0A067BG56_SAPPC|nr:ribosomal protein S3 [Saprolegnia parasitica CBS 223.65]KDO15685.1 ribosomal protein S3 [Saprolegnia parasitica CBS 223.65]|eukprot:XP_012213615.1 ribosomal protein S3 (mitochondrion) [Saprolegnia parasitica CBS 223.65]
MGQKIIPISLRLKNRKNWHSQWIVEKKNYAEILHFDLELRKYIETLLNNKKISTLQIKINKVSKNLYIYVFVHNTFKKEILKKQSNILFHLNSYLNNKYNIKLFFLKAHFKLNNYQKNLRFYIYKYLKKKRRRLKDKKILKFLSICQIAFTLGKMNIISKYIVRTIKKKKIHRGYLNFINRILKEYFKMNSKILGYKLQVKGRVNGAKRKRKLVYQEGRIPLSSLDKNIQYTFDEFITKSGVCSVKMWFYLKDTTKLNKLVKLKKIKGHFKNNSKKMLNFKNKQQKNKYTFNLSKK